MQARRHERFDFTTGDYHQLKKLEAGMRGDSDIGIASIAEQRALLHARKVSATEATTSYLDEVNKNRDLNIFITINREGALERAKQSDERIAQGRERPLDGIAIAVKDNFCTQGIRTTAASKILAVSRSPDDGFIPPYESTVTKRLLDAGAIIIGKTNMDEFAMGSSTESSYFGPTINPVGIRLGYSNLVPGGSSGGSAAAVAARLCLGAIGTDTGGSVRQPASFCGVVGMKPSYGVCSRWGIIAYASSLDQAGAFGKCVEDVAIIMDLIAGEDGMDTTSVTGLKLNLVEALARPPERLKIGFPKEVLAMASTEEADMVWRQAERIARHMDAELVEVSVPSFKFALPAYYIIALSEASSNLARYDGVRYGRRTGAPKDITSMYEQTRSEGFGAEVKRRIMVGTYSLSEGYYDAHYLKAMQVRRVIANEFASAFKCADVMFMPTAPTAAFEIGSHRGNPVQMYLEDLFTVPVNLAGLPAVSVPVTLDTRGMPLGLQIIGPQFGDETVVRAAASVEIAASVLGP
jgi:aspartyl-tRNA(Asn)/glutamyl-tRNA(Gln) amidotransferase subunit A